MKNIFKLAIDIGHNVNFDGGAVGFKDENGLNYLQFIIMLDRRRR